MATNTQQLAISNDGWTCRGCGAGITGDDETGPVMTHAADCPELASLRA